MRSKARERVLAAGALLALVACGGRSQPAGTSEPLRIASPFDLSTLDPHAVDRLDHFALLINIYEPLVANDPELRLVPALAERWENPDDTTWVFHLRRGVRFHSGRLLSAEDVVSSIQRLRERPDLEYRSYVLDVVAVFAEGPGRVVIRTAGRSRSVLSRLANVLIVPQGASDEALRAAADGTGPYSLAAWRPGESLQLARSGSWSGRALPERVEFALAREASEAVDGLLGGRYDLVRADSRAAVERAGDRFRVVRRENLFTKMLAFDHRRERTPFSSAPRNPFRELRVRRALDLGLDRAAIARALPRHALPTNQPVARFVFGFDPTVPPPVTDLAAARRLLGEAGFGKGFEVTLHTRKGFLDGARAVRDALLPLGIRVEIMTLPDAEYFAFLSQGGPSLWFDRFGCTTGEATELLEDLVHSRDPARHLGTLNFGGFSDAELDRLIEETARLDNPGRRRDALQRALRLTLERLPVVSLFNDEDVYLMRPDLAFRPRADSYLPVEEMVR
jgi:peptide/nickel transport system substrate-binding protein